MNFALLACLLAVSNVHASNLAVPCVKSNEKYKVSTTALTQLMQQLTSERISCQRKKTSFQTRLPKHETSVSVINYSQNFKCKR